MTAEQIQLDRYAKFRKLGQFREYVVRGGDWRNADGEREKVSHGACLMRQSSCFYDDVLVPDA